MEETDPKKFNLPTRLDRLIAFLDSYFGQVELIVPTEEEMNSVPEETEEVEMAAVEEDDEDGKVLAENGAEVEEKVVIKKTGKVPVIRVRLDENFADVTVEDLVRASLH